MPSGLLNDRGCYDSLQKCQDEAALFLTIRHHNTSFLLDQRKAIQEANKSAQVLTKKNFDSDVREQFKRKALPALRSVIKFLFLVFVFPFYFCFKRLPQLAKEKAFIPLQKFILRATRPIFAFFQRLFKPFVVAYQKVVAVYQRFSNFVHRQYEKCRKFYQRIQSKVQVTVIAPPMRVVYKVRHFIHRNLENCLYGMKYAQAWTKLLIEYGLDLVRTQGKSKNDL
ncbi:MAG: hypothetical protein ACXWM7_04740 [Parachlamydiaceae bacterium]